MNTELVDQNKIRFFGAVYFEMDADDAIAILALPKADRYQVCPRDKALQEWLATHPATHRDNQCLPSVLDELEKGLGQYLVDRKIEERRLLSAPTGETIPLEAGAA